MVTESKELGEGRSKLGRFLPGHPDFVSETGAKVGRPKSLKREIKDALKVAEDALPQLYLDMVKDAQDESIPIAVRQAIREYLSDRIYGRPNQPLSGVGKAPLIQFIIGRGYADVQGQGKTEASE